MQFEANAREWLELARTAELVELYQCTVSDNRTSVVFQGLTTFALRLTEQILTRKEAP